MKIRNQLPSPLAEEYLAKKKLDAQSKKAQDLRTNTMQTDTVTLSTGQTDDLTPTAKPQPSKPVTLEEQRLLNSTFSVQA
jgi:hypothetical protein